MSIHSDKFLYEECRGFSVSSSFCYFFKTQKNTLPPQISQVYSSERKCLETKLAESDIFKPQSLSPWGRHVKQMNCSAWSSPLTARKTQRQRKCSQVAQTSMSLLPALQHRCHLAQTLTLRFFDSDGWQWEVSGAQQVLKAHWRTEGKATCSVHLHILITQAVWDSQNLTQDIEHLSWLRQRSLTLFWIIISEIIISQRGLRLFWILIICYMLQVFATGQHPWAIYNQI